MTLQEVLDSTMAVMPIIMRRFEKGLRVDLPVARAERERLLAEIASEESAWQAEVTGRSPERQARIEAWEKEAEELALAADQIREERAEEIAALREKGLKRQLSPLPKAAQGALSRATKLREKARKEKQISFKSPKQLGRLLYEDLRLPTRTKGAEGPLTTDEDALLELISLTQDRSLRAILELRRKHKIAKTFFGEKMVGEASGGRIHFWVNLTRNNEQWSKSGACTGRWSTKPSVQVMPKKLRHVWLPDQDDHVIIGADWASAEIRAIAWMTGHATGDWALWQFLRGGDVYRRFAAMRLGIQENQITQEQRDGHKSFALGINYGMGEVKGAMLWGCSRQEARETIKVYLDSMFGLRGFREWAVRVGTANGKLVNPFGRPRYFPDDSFASEMINWFPQSIVGDMLNRTVAEVEAGLRRISLTEDLADQALWLHDAIYISCREMDAGRVGKILREAMEREWSPWMPGFQVPAEVKVGRCFREHPKDKPISEWDGKDMVPVAGWEKRA